MSFSEWTEQQEFNQEVLRRNEARAEIHDIKKELDQLDVEKKHLLLKLKELESEL
jgi:hypothetical protein